jgi:hypothetical protein
MVWCLLMQRGSFTFSFTDRELLVQKYGHESSGGGRRKIQEKNDTCNVGQGSSTTACKVGYISLRTLQGHVK